MLKSLKSKISCLVISAAVLGSISICRADGTIGNITILGLTGTDTFTAGIATNTVANDIIFNILTSTNGIPDAGQTVSLSLLESGSTLENGMNNVTMTTDGTGTLFGGGSRPTITFYHAGSVALRATSSNGVTSTSDPFTVVAGTGTKLILVGPGQTLDPGRNPSISGEDGVTGSFLAQEVNQAFTVTAHVTDNQFNQVSSPLSVNFTVPADVTMAATTGSLNASGQGDFQVTITAPNTTRTLTVAASTDTGVANGTLSVTTVGPPEQEVFPFPSPFNPTQGNITFRYRVTTSKSVTLIVTDIFGQKVWEQSSSGSPGINDVTWNGRNGKGEIVAAGVYYVLFETDGSIESKRRFGVIK